MSDDKELDEIQAFFLAMQTPTPKRTLTIRSESGEFIGYCEVPEIEDVYAALRVEAGKHLKRLGKNYLYHKKVYFDVIKWAEVGSYYTEQASLSMTRALAFISVAIAAYRAVEILHSPRNP